MTKGIGSRQLVVRETLLALLVIALTFLNFGHSNAVFAAGGRVVVTTSSTCGNPLIPAAGDHAPCHACRIGDAAALPPPPLTVRPVAFAMAPVVYLDPVVSIVAAPRFVAARPRAPPLA